MLLARQPGFAPKVLAHDVRCGRITGKPAPIRSDAHSCCAAEREEVKEMSEDLPVTGAWAPGDPVGRRQFFTFADDRPFALDSGSVLQSVTLAYETWGELNSDASNAILICHAWTGDSHLSLIHI